MLVAKEKDAERLAEEKKVTVSGYIRNLNRCKGRQKQNEANG